MKLLLLALIATFAAINAEDAPQHLRRLDTWVKPNVQCSDGTKTVVAKVKTDNYPAETTMWITDKASGVKVLALWKLTNRLTTYTAENDLCVNHCYVTHIEDSYKDGICCGYGDGMYEVLVDGDQVLEGGEFTDKETEEFCIKPSPVLMEPVNFQGWDGKNCMNRYGKELKEGEDYKVKPDITLRECMALACEDKNLVGYGFIDQTKYEDSECHLIKKNYKTQVAKFKDQEGAICFFKR